MKLSITQGPDKSDPFNQVTYIAAQERIGDKQYSSAIALSDFDLSRTNEMETLLRAAGQRLAAEFARVVEDNLQAEFIKVLEISVFRTWPVQSLPKEEALLPKDILVELEQLDEKRISENLHVAV